MTTTVKERPILFSGPMVKAILEGRKTQTRRVLKRQPNHSNAWEVRTEGDYVTAYAREGASDFGSYAGIARLSACPYGKPGDRLWVRETFLCAGHKEFGHFVPAYKADGEDDAGKAGDAVRTICRYDTRKWRPSIHMFRSFSRITLEITEVRVERLHDISEADKLAEGATPEIPFGTVWRKINTKPGIRWEDNPFVWVITFRRLEAS